MLSEAVADVDSAPHVDDLMHYRVLAKTITLPLRGTTPPSEWPGETRTKTDLDPKPVPALAPEVEPRAQLRAWRLFWFAECDSGATAELMGSIYVG